VIVVVPLEELLSGNASQGLKVGLELLVLNVSPLLIDILLVEVVLPGWDKRCLDSLVSQVVPGEVSQPRMLLHFFGAVRTQPILRLPLDHSVDEVGGLGGPASWNVFVLDLNLLGEDVVSDLLSRLADIRTPTEHAFEGHDADSEKVYRSGVVLATHHLRGHVAWRARCILCVVLAPDASDTKVSDAHVAISINNKIFGLDISMNDLFLVEVLQAAHKARHEEARCLFVEAAMATYMVAQITP